MPKNINFHESDLVILGAGTSGTMSAIGAVQLGLNVTLIGNNTNFMHSSLLTEIIPNTTFNYCGKLASLIQQASNFGLDANFTMVNTHQVNQYIHRIVGEFNQENELELFKKLGGRLIQGTATFMDPNQVIVGKQAIRAKNFIIATGAREPYPEILNLTKYDFISYKELFRTNISIKTIMIIAAKPESLAIAQTLTRFGAKVKIICCHNDLLPLEDPALTSKLINRLIDTGISFFYVTKIIEFFTQNHRKILVCQDLTGSSITIDADEIINLPKNIPNTEELILENANIAYTNQGILVNDKLQTTQKNIFAIGTVIDTPLHSIHCIENQINVILSNIAFKIPNKINYNWIPRSLDTDPALASVGLTSPRTMIDPNTQSEKTIDQVLTFDFKNIDAAIYQQNNYGEIKVICNNQKILGVSILGPNATEIINEFTLAMRLGIEISEIAKNTHIYPSLAQINKRVAHQHWHNFNGGQKIINQTFLTLRKLFNKIPFN